MTGISVVWPTHHCLQPFHMTSQPSLFRVGATFPGMLSGFKLARKDNTAKPRISCLKDSFTTRLSLTFISILVVPPSSVLFSLLCLCAGWWPNPAPTCSRFRQKGLVTLSPTMSWRSCIDPKRCRKSSVGF